MAAVALQNLDPYPLVQYNSFVMFMEVPCGVVHAYYFCNLSP